MTTTGKGRKKDQTRVTTDILHFLRKNVLTVTDLTRRHKLAEILDKYSEGMNTEVFVVQNTKKPEGKAVIADLEYFQELLAYKEAMEWATDQHMLDLAHERTKDENNEKIPFDQVLREEGFDAEEILKLADEIEEEY